MIEFAVINFKVRCVEEAIAGLFALAIVGLSFIIAYLLHRFREKIQNEDDLYKINGTLLKNKMTIEGEGEKCERHFHVYLKEFPFVFTVPRKYSKRVNSMKFVENLQTGEKVSLYVSVSQKKKLENKARYNKSKNDRINLYQIDSKEFTLLNKDYIAYITNVEKNDASVCLFLGLLWSIGAIGLYLIFLA